MLQVGDIVKEIATKRLGRIGFTRGSIEAPSEWCVFFLDGMEPILKIFFNVGDLQQVT
jgi:hypothetical protein